MFICCVLLWHCERHGLNHPLCVVICTSYGGAHYFLWVYQLLFSNILPCANLFPPIPVLKICQLRNPFVTLQAYMHQYYSHQMINEFRTVFSRFPVLGNLWYLLYRARAIELNIKDSDWLGELDGSVLPEGRTTLANLTATSCWCFSLPWPACFLSRELYP